MQFPTCIIHIHKEWHKCVFKALRNNNSHSIDIVQEHRKLQSTAKKYFMRLIALISKPNKDNLKVILIN